MKALTLIQPWAWAICYAGKRIENRVWRAPLWLKDQVFAIHAGKKNNLEACADLVAEELPVPLKHQMVQSAVVALVRLTGCKPVEQVAHREQRSRWAFGPWCWELADLVVLPKPVPCPGARGLWDLPPDVEKAVLAQVPR